MALLAHTPELAGDDAWFGLRTRDEVAARIAALRSDAETPPLSREELALIEAILTLRETAPNVLSSLRDIVVDLPAINAAASATSSMSIMRPAPFFGSHGAPGLASARRARIWAVSSRT